MTAEDNFYPGELQVRKVAVIKEGLLRVDCTCYKSTKVMEFEITLDVSQYVGTDTDFSSILTPLLLAEIKKLYTTAEYVAGSRSI